MTRLCTICLFQLFYGIRSDPLSWPKLITLDKPYPYLNTHSGLLSIIGVPDRQKSFYQHRGTEGSVNNRIRRQPERLNHWCCKTRDFKTNTLMHISTNCVGSTTYKCYCGYATKSKDKHMKTLRKILHSSISIGNMT